MLTKNKVIINFLTNQQIMNSNEFGQPDKFQLSSVVTKNSRSGFTSNRRLLVIKAGKLYYYSNIPKFFDSKTDSHTGNIKALQMAHQLPKCSIDIVLIRNVNEFDLNSPYFSIEFEAKHMMEKEEIRNSAMNMDYNFTPKDVGEEITWQFTCENQFIKKRWVSALKGLKDYYKLQEIKMQQFYQSMNRNSPPHTSPEEFKSSSYSSRSSIKMPVPWRESNFSRKSYSIQKGFQFKQSPKDTLKVEEPSFLKKEKSDRSLSNAHSGQSFQMVIQENISNPGETIKRGEKETVKAHRIQDVFKNMMEPKKQQKQIKKPIYNQPNSPRSPRSPSKEDLKRSFNSSNSGPLPLPVPIEQVSEQVSFPPTPIKDNDVVSYSDSDSFYSKKQSLNKVLAELKLPPTSRPFKKNNLQFHQSFSIEVPGLTVVTEEKTQFMNSKSLIQEEKETLSKEVSRDMELTPRQTQLAYRESVENQHPSFLETRKSILPFEQKSIEENQDESKQQSILQDEDDRLQHRFEWLWGQSCKPNSSFEGKVAIQKQLLGQILIFKQRAIESVSSWLQSKLKGENRYPIVEQTPKYLTLQVGNVLLKVANLPTQKIVINGTTKIFYNEDSIKNIKKQFKIHQNLFRTISKQLKIQPSLKLRLPLSIYIEYKGVCCIATRQHHSQRQIHSLLEDQWQEELNFIIAEGYKPEWFNFKTIGTYLQLSIRSKVKYLGNDDQSIKEYLKKVVRLGKKQKNHNLVFDPPINKTFLEIAIKQNASTSIQSLQRYVKGLKLAKNLNGPCPKEEIIQALNYCLFCKQLRKVYRSAQGQIGETHFFNLLLKRDPQLIQLLEQSDCHLPQQITAQLFSFIEHYFGVTLEIDEKIYNQGTSRGVKKDMFVSSSARPLVRQYSLEGYQIVQSYSKLQVYLQKKHPLAKAALKMKKQVFRMSQNLSQDQHLQILYNQASHLYFQADFTGCIKKCKEYETVCNPKSANLFPLYLLMMKAYSSFSEPDFSQTFKKTQRLVQFNYGKNNSCLINLNSLAAFYYQKLMNTPNTNAGYNMKELSAKLMKEAQELCVSAFGSSSKQYLDIILDSSRLLSKVDTQVAVNYLEEVKRLCQTNSALFIPENLISILSFQTQFNINRGLFNQAETTAANAISLMNHKTTQKTKIHLYKLQHQVGLCTEKHDLCEDAIQRLWQLGSFQKIEALELAYRLAFKQTGTSEAEIALNEYQYGEGQERGLIQLQQLKQSFDNLVDMLASAIENNNSKVLSLAALLINQHRVSS